jgi:flagellar biosynthesis protein FlhG
MSDQADKLRQLVVEAAPRIRVGAVLPPIVVVTGGKGGVGATTVSINLSAALAELGRRPLLVDAAPHADAAQLLGIEIERGRGIEDVLSGACRTADAITIGPAGISLLAGQWAAEAAPERSPKSFERFIGQLRALDTHADVLVVDSGSGVTNWTRRWWQEAALALLVTTPDDVAVMDAYATVKRGLAADDAVDLRVLVNACRDAATAVDVQHRIAAACRRFLGRTIGQAPMLPRHVDGGAAETDAPLAWNTVGSRFTRNVHQLGRFVVDVLAQKKNLATRRTTCSRELVAC